MIDWNLNYSSLNELNKNIYKKEFWLLCWLDLYYCRELKLNVWKIFQDEEEKLLYLFS